MRIVLLLDEGSSYHDIEEKLGAPASTVSRWKQRYQEDGVLGLATIHPGQPPQKLTPELRARVLQRTRQAPPDGSTHWSLRKMAALMKVSKNLIARIWKEADLKPHRLDRYMASNDSQGRCIRVDSNDLSMSQVQQIVDSLLPDVPVQRRRKAPEDGFELLVVDRDVFALELAREWVRSGWPRSPVR
jgi:transposase